MTGVLATFAASLALAAMPIQPAHLDAHLTTRAQEYFRALEHANYATIWSHSSESVQKDSDRDEALFTERLRDTTPYDIRADLLAGWSADDRGEIYLRMSIRPTRADDATVEDYVSHWTFENGDWFLDDLTETDDLEEVLTQIPPIDPASN